MKKPCVVLGVTGGIAVYKACELLRLLQKRGIDVFVVMTQNACRFVAPLTFETLSGHPVAVDTFDRPQTWEVEHIALAKPADVDELLAQKYVDDESKTITDLVSDATVAIGEKISIRRFARYETAGEVSTYIHMLGKVGVLVEVSTDKKCDEVKTFAHDLALQIAAAKPEAVRREEVDASKLEKEKEIRIATAKQDPKNAKKPDAIIEKIVVGGLGKWFKEICLLQMPFVKDDKVSVEQHVAAVAKELGTPVTVKGYVRFEKGEGIEKRQDDLAAEVAKMVNG